MYGWRGRIGLMIPSTNTTMEPDFNRMAPEGVSVHSARLLTEREGTFEQLIRMEGEAEGAAAMLATCAPGVIAYGCTSGTFVKGSNWNRQIVKKLSDKTGIPVVTTAGSMVDALLSLNLKRISVVTPYVKKTNERLVKFVEAHGIQVLGLKTFDVLDMFEHAKTEPWEIYELARKAWRRESQGLFIACTQLRALDVLDDLEADLGRPVLSATQATMWAALRTLGVRADVQGFGSLLRNPGSAR